jgi:hypothetical protein
VVIIGVEKLMIATRSTGNGREQEEKMQSRTASIESSSGA